MGRLCFRVVLMVLLGGFIMVSADLFPVAAAEVSLAPDTSAESAVLLDGNGDILFEKDCHKSLPPASVTKVMTLLLGVEAVEQGRIKLTDQVFTSENAWRQGGSQIWLEPGEVMNVRELMTAIAVVSANDAAVALMANIYGSEQAAVEAMNQRAKRLGLNDSKFVNVNGLPVEGHYMSVYDTALIAREAVRHPLYMELCGIKEYWLRDGKNWLVNTNKLLWWYRGADGLKTGWTDEAKYCFVGTAKRDNLRLIAVVFATPEPRSHLRESMKLLDWGFANFSAVPIVTKGAVVERALVVRGVEPEVDVLAKREMIIIVPKGKDKNISTTIEVDKSLRAPVAQGEKCGVLTVSQSGKQLGKVDLIAAKNIAKAGFIQIFTGMLDRLFAISS
jgi:serine-type D-Ala-D-Ala carboxypeptidase (penicillin-binding protein 5/6)